MNDYFGDKIRVAGKEDQKWQERGRQLVRIRESGTRCRTNEQKRTAYSITKIVCTSPRTKTCNPRLPKAVTTH